MTISEFSDVANVTIEIRCSPRSSGPWIADIERGEIKGHGVLTSTTGWGKTPSEALEAMIKGIRGKTLVIGAYTDARREIQIPKTLVVQ